MSRSPGLAVVTGASSGIGAAMTRELARRGQPVLAVARRADRLLALAEEATRDGRAAVHAMPLDVAQDGAAERVRDRARELGGAAWLVNDAGMGLYGPFAELPAPRLSQLMRVNCEALVLLAHAFVPDLVAAGRGVVLNVASLAAFQPTPFMTVYGATKAFVLSFSEGLAEELRGTGVSVTAFCPGPVATEFGDVAGYFARARLQSPPGSIGAEEAARAAIAAADRGDAVAVPGGMSKLAAAFVAALPRAVVRRASGLLLAPRTRGPGDSGGE